MNSPSDVSGYEYSIIIYNYDTYSLTVKVILYMYYLWICPGFNNNPRRACARVITVLGLCVCVSVATFSATTFSATTFSATACNNAPNRIYRYTSGETRYGTFFSTMYGF